MSAADGSIWPRSTPWRAHAGSEWCVSVKADRHPEARQQVKERRQAQVGQSDAVSPQQEDGSGQAGERDGHDRPGHRQRAGPLPRQLKGLSTGTPAC
jgi:hypothetical protein